MTPNFPNAVWFKSSRSGGNGGDCVEVANLDQVVAVRDSKQPDGGMLVFNCFEWVSFVDAAKNGEFDH
jgi:Domain of unknown function (DUF397).